MSKADNDVGTGLVGAPACGDVMKLQIRVDPNSNTISDVKFKTFGCGSAIASSSYLTELVRGMSLEDAGKIRNTEIARELCLPPVKCELVDRKGECMGTFIKDETISMMVADSILNSTLLYAGRRCYQIRHFKLLQQEPKSKSDRSWRHGCFHAEGGYRDCHGLPSPADCDGLARKFEPR